MDLDDVLTDRLDEDERLADDELDRLISTVLDDEVLNEADELDDDRDTRAVELLDGVLYDDREVLDELGDE